MQGVTFEAIKWNRVCFSGWQKGTIVDDPFFGPSRVIGFYSVMDGTARYAVLETTDPERTAEVRAKFDAGGVL